MNYYFYSLEFYNEYTDKEEPVNGVTVGNNYSEAISNLISFYGESNIIKISLLEPTGDENCFELPEEIFNSFDK